MASNDFAKCKGAAEVKAKFGHTTKDERLRRNHTNKNIDKTRTHLNTSIHGLETGTDYTYSELCALYDERMEAFDSVPGQNKRKDRVTVFTVETPAPAGLPPEKQDAWFLRVAEIERGIWGAENYIDGHIDRDEEHEYMHPVTKEMVTSRVHMVSYIFPADKDGKLVAKNATRRANINRLNKAVEEMSVNEFGVHFMTGSKQKSTETVDELKAKSERAEIEAMAAKMEEAARIFDELNAEAVSTENAVQQMRQERDTAQKERDSAIAERDTAKKDADAEVQRKENAEKAADEAERKAANAAPLAEQADASQRRLDASVKALKAIQGEEFEYKGQKVKGSAGLRRERDELLGQVAEAQTVLDDMNAEIERKRNGKSELDEFKEYVSSDEFAEEHPLLSHVSGKILEAVELFRRRQQERMLRRKKALEHAEKEQMLRRRGLYDEGGVSTPSAGDMQLG